jgi:MFS superfamily sulfate permease-like transporter
VPDAAEIQPPAGEQVSAVQAKGGEAKVSRWQKFKSIFTTYRVLYVAVVLIGVFALAVNLVDLGWVSRVPSFPEELYLADSEVILAGAAIVAIVIEVKRDLDRRNDQGVAESRAP